MLFHLRAKLAGTVLVDGDEVELLDTKTDKTISAFTYPYWHPSGRYIAFSINRTTQQLHSTQRTEVYDTASDVIVYDVERHTFCLCPDSLRSQVLIRFPLFLRMVRVCFIALLRLA